jgi:Tol biopolymer transport system component
MTTNDRFERAMSGWLHDDAAGRVTDHPDEVLAVTTTPRQRPAWSSPERWLPVDLTLRPRLYQTPRLSRIVLVAALILAVLATLLLYAGTHRQRLPDPFGPARNGIFVSSRNGDIFTVDPNTQATSPLVLGVGFDFSPIFSRDGTRIVFLRTDGQPSSAPGSVATLTMMVANADGSDPHAVTPPTESLDWFDWSPDGGHIAYVAKGQLWVADARGGAPLSLRGATPAFFPTWLPPDGQEIVFRREGSSPAIMTIRPDGTGLRQISESPANNEYDFGSLGVSPDGSNVTFTRWSSDVPYADTRGWLPRVVALDVAAGREMLFPTPPETGQRGPVAYSPDGALVAYARIDRGGLFQLVVANADGTGNERTVGPLRVGPPDGSSIDASWAFTPDGKALVVRYGTDDAGATHLLPLDGSPETQIIGSAGFEFVDVQRLAP